MSVRSVISANSKTYGNGKDSSIDWFSNTTSKTLMQRKANTINGTITNAAINTELTMSSIVS